MASIDSRTLYQLKKWIDEEVVIFIGRNEVYFGKLHNVAEEKEPPYILLGPQSVHYKRKGPDNIDTLMDHDLHLIKLDMAVEIIERRGLTESYFEEGKIKIGLYHLLIRHAENLQAILSVLYRR